MSNYTKGRALEYQVMHTLTDKGYRCFRSAGSHSPVDVLAVKRGECLAIQAKTGGVISAKDWNILWDICQEIDYTPVLVERDRGLKFHIITGPKEKRGVYPWEEWEP